ncbi:MAG: PQQ-binding-like beta-propeller repeat protein, partial [Planctomycetaceae bacterium]
MLFALGTVGIANGADWPTWGGNASRTGTVSESLPETLHLSWKLQLREPDPAWHSNQDRVQFDRMYEPVVAGKRLFVGSMVGDRVTAYDTESGSELWRFYTEGPVRLAPAVWNDKVYFACDDGHLYCLQAADGSLVWKFYGSPLDRKVLGNDRLISIYPARGAPVIYDGKVYFASSIW